MQWVQGSGFTWFGRTLRHGRRKQAVVEFLETSEISLWQGLTGKETTERVWKKPLNSYSFVIMKRERKNPP
jgi:hypothetical protein